MMRRPLSLAHALLWEMTALSVRLRWFGAAMEARPDLIELAACGFARYVVRRAWAGMAPGWIEPGGMELQKDAAPLGECASAVLDDE